MDFKKIFNGMIGKDFIIAFNDNVNICDKNFLEILASLMYKIKSTDIKEFRVLDGVVSYTLEEAPTEGEDNRTWTPVDITQWGNIQGNITNQYDLMQILNDKAARETVENMNNLLSTLNQNFSLLRTKVEDNETKLNTNINDLADLQDDIDDMVTSTNIKAIRLSDAVFQWSPDGVTWYEHVNVTTTPWGKITGDISNQEDLIQKFTEINNDINELNSNYSSLSNTLNTNTTKLNDLESTLNNHITTTETSNEELKTLVNTTKETSENAASTSNAVKTSLDAHLADYENPHHVTSTTIGLGNVDNTSDADKPLSTAQKSYVDEQIRSIANNSFNGAGFVGGTGYVTKLYVGPSSDYETLTEDKSSMLAFILDDSYFTTTVTLTSSKYSLTEMFLKKDGVKLMADNELEDPVNAKTYNNLSKGTYVYGVTLNAYDYEVPVELNFKEANAFDIDEAVDAKIAEEEGGNG